MAKKTNKNSGSRGLHVNVKTAAKRSNSSVRWLARQLNDPYVTKAKAEGYRRLIEACGQDAAVGPTLLLIEQLPKLVEQQVKAVQGLKIDKITVWDQGTGGSGRNATADFLSGMIGSLPRLHELASQAGIELPPALGRLARTDAAPSAKAAQEPPKT